MDSTVIKSNKRKKPASSEAQSPSSEVQSPSSEVQSPRSIPSASASGKTKTSLRQRREQDLSYLQRPTAKPSTHPLQAPLNSNFDRPNTRAHRSLDPGSDAAELKPPPGTSKVRKKKAESVEPSSAVADVGNENSLTSETSQAILEIDRAISETEAQEQEDSVETIEFVRSDEDQAESNDLDEDAVEDSSTSSDARAVSSEPTAISETPEASEPAAATEEAQLEHQNERPSTPPPAPTPDGDYLTTVPSTPTRIPAQIAIVHSSPSKRVAFSPNKQESRLSTPSTIPTMNLRSILKTNMRLPFQVEDADITGQGSGGVSRRDPINDTLANDDDLTVVESFVKMAIEALGSDDLQLRAATYTSLQTKFRADNDTLHLEEVRATIRTFTTYLLRDLDPSNPSNLVQAGLKCAGYYLFNHSFVVLFTAKETESLLKSILRIINTTDEKPICNIAVWCLASARVPPKFLVPFLPMMVRAFSENLDSRFKSLSIMNESLLAREVLPQVQTWLIPVIMKLVNNTPGIRSKALELITLATPKLIEKEDPRRIQVIQRFMKDHSTGFFELLTQNFLDSGDEVYAITVWGAMVTLIGRLLHKSPSLNPLLKMAEKCFNSTSPRRTEIKMAAFQAWTRLIYNFAIGGHIASEKPLKLMLTPIRNGFHAERLNRVRLACANAWVSLIYAVGPKLSENAEQVLFEQLRHVAVDPSEHIRDLVLRLLMALFSNTGGQELVEGRQNIVPGTISFADLGLSDAVWVRTALLDEGLDCLHSTIAMQPKLTEVTFEDWRASALTGLPLLSQRCARTWETIVWAVRDINGQEKELRATTEADLAMSRLLQFIEKISLQSPKEITPKEWSEKNQRGLVYLRNDMHAADYIYRADTVHYFYSSLVDIFSAKTLASHRYRIRDWIRAEIYSAVHQSSEPLLLATDFMERSSDENQELILTPIESILKTWLVTGESILRTAFETSFWQAVATLVDMSKSGINVFQGMYQAMRHMNDIKSRRRLRTPRPEDEPCLLPPLIFRDFQCKYWSIIAQRLGTTIHNTNELADHVSKANDRGYEDLFELMTYPFMILHDPDKLVPQLDQMDSTQQTLMSQETEPTTEEVQFMDKFRTICMPTWTDLLRNVYKVIQHKFGNANAAMDLLARSIRNCYHWRLPFICNLDHLLSLCAFLFDKAYKAIKTTQRLCEDAEIPPIQESTFILMEKIINKGPSSLTVEWLQQLQQPIIQWMEDPLDNITNLPKASRRAYQARIETLWNNCVLAKLMNCSTEDNSRGSTNVFGSVIMPRLSTIRSAAQQTAAMTENALPSTPSTGLQGYRDSEKNTILYNSKTLAFISPLLFVGLNSLRKSIVNKTLEFWNKTFGLSTTDLEYPEDLVSILRQLKPVASINLPGWPYEDNSQTEVPQFASLSQEMLSLPSELNVRSSLSKLLKLKADTAAQLAQNRKKNDVQDLAQENVSGSGRTDTTATSGSRSRTMTSGSGRASTPENTSSSDTDSSEQSNDESRNLRKRKRDKAQAANSLDTTHGTPTKRIKGPTIPGASQDESDSSSRANRNDMVVIKVEQPSSPREWELQPLLKPYNVADDVSTLDGLLGEGDETENHESQITGSNITNGKGLKGTNPVVEGGNAWEMQETTTSSIEMWDSSTTSHTAERIKSKSTHGLSSGSSVMAMAQEMEMDIIPMVPFLVSQESQDVSIPIDTSEDFTNVVQWLVDKRVVIGQMDMRQLSELQSKLVTLNQTVCEVWGRLIKDKDRSAGQ
ncbi:DNA-binding protein rif1 [Modicella reniformis]|uniref:DNA-binding protein rif1 n=1 Tax=Modicella reniformis TaxID=1440133 RepID=A0A9P6LUK3_9FUNG|nr:DNA-binding protein rif1 [Modicella reniformis]